nr:MAG TPA: hypothetical protein [Bacteriophage sp.]
MDLTQAQQAMQRDSARAGLWSHLPTLVTLIGR